MSDKDEQLIELEVFKTGKHLANDHRWRTYTDQELDEIVDTYDPKTFRAPLLVTAQNDHRHPGSPEYVSEDPLLSHGIPSQLKREGSSLKAVFENTSKAFKNWLTEKRIPGFSVALYEPSDPRNPYPGKHALRHIATVLHPAVKGCGMPNFSEISSGADVESLKEYNLSEGVSFSDTTLAAPKYSEATNIVARLFSSLRDYLVEEKGREVAENILPQDLVQDVVMFGMDTSDRVYKWDIERLENEVDSLRTTVEPLLEEYRKNEEGIFMSETKDTSPAQQVVDAAQSVVGKVESGIAQIEDMKAKLETDRAAFSEERNKFDADRSAFEAERTRIQQELDAARLEIKTASVAAYCEKTFSPEQLKPSSVEFSEGKPASIVDFMVSLDDRQRQFFEEWVQKTGKPAPPPSDSPLFSEVTGGTSNPSSPPSEISNPEFDEASVASFRKIQAYANERGISYRQAFSEVNK